MSLTPKQKAVLDFIEAFLKENGYSPSQAEIAKHFGFNSLGTVQNYLVRLERQGLLHKTLNARRGMHRTHDDAPGASSGSVPLPLLGRVAAGRPIEAIANEDTFDVPMSLIPRHSGDHFVLKVLGDSMIEDGILSGDYVVIRKQKAARDGQTVVALLGNEATLKRFYKHAGSPANPNETLIELRPANSNYQPLMISSLVENRDFQIEGVMVGLIRRLD